MTENILQGNCPSNYDIVRTWTATDACGNAKSVTQTINVTDGVGPVLATEMPIKVIATCDAIPDVPTLVFTDNCTSTVVTPTPTITTSDIVDNVYTITRTWTVTDACGNTTTVTQSVHVTQTTEVVTVEKTSCTNEDLIYTLRDLLPNPNDIPVDAIWTNVDNVGGFTNGTTFNAFQIPAGLYTFSYEITTGLCPRRIEIKMTVDVDCGVLPCQDVVIHNAFTPNNDEFNQFFNIEHIEEDCHLPNTVEIYNRWGVLVYETKNYDNASRRFEGISEGRVTISKSDELPTGTYFYIIQWTDTTTGKTINKDGYLYLTR
jgi:gliding motility-associated-like protein